MELLFEKSEIDANVANKFMQKATKKERNPKILLTITIKIANEVNL